DRPAQSHALPVAARRPARPVRNQGVRRGNARRAEALGAADLRFLPPTSPARGDLLRRRARGGEADAGRGGADAGDEQPVEARVARADGRARPRRLRPFAALSCRPFTIRYGLRPISCVGSWTRSKLGLKQNTKGVMLRRRFLFLLLLTLSVLA